MPRAERSLSGKEISYRTNVGKLSCLNVLIVLRRRSIDYQICLHYL